jgi:hypothetical protein
MAEPSVGVERPASQPFGTWQRRQRSPEPSKSCSAIAMVAQNRGSRLAWDIKPPVQLNQGSPAGSKLPWQLSHLETDWIWLASPGCVPGCCTSVGTVSAAPAASARAPSSATCTPICSAKLPRSLRLMSITSI